LNSLTSDQLIVLCCEREIPYISKDGSISKNNILIKSLLSFQSRSYSFYTLRDRIKHTKFTHKVIENLEFRDYEYDKNHKDGRNGIVISS
jgi:hypothetical protein